MAQNAPSQGRKNVSTLIALGIFSFMSTLDGSIVNIAMPIMSKALNMSSSQIEWVVSIYLITISSLLMFFGRLGDVVGRSRVFKIGTAVFILGSFLSGLNMGLAFLLFSRVIQATGAAMTMSNSFGITTSTFPASQRGRAMGVIGTFVALGSVAGPAFGGLILNYLPWNYIFWINVPIGLIAILIGLRSLPKQEPVQAAPIDWLGTGTFTLVIVSFFYGVLQAQVVGFTPIIWASFVVAILSFIAFVYVENHAKAPLLDLSIFKIADYSLGLIAALLVFINGFFFNVLIPYYLVNARGFSSGFSGILLSIIPLTMLVSGPVGGVLADRFGGPKIAALGLSIAVIAQFMTVLFGLDTSLWYFGGTAILIGIGLGLFQSPNNATVMSAVPTDRLGIAGSVNALARNLGMILGVSFSTTSLFGIMSAQAGQRVTTYPLHQNDLFISAMRLSFFISAILLVIAAAIAFERLRQGKKSKA